MNKYLFLDLDETLIHSMNIRGDVNWAWINAQPFENIVLVTAEGNKYVAFLRPGVLEFLDWCRSEYGAGNIRILTTATFEYAKMVSDGLELGFNRYQIIDRVPIYQRDETFNEDGRCVLVDNMTYEEHAYGRRCKVKYLNGIPKSQYIQILDFILVDDPENY